MKNLFAYCLTGLFCVFGCGNPQRQPTQTESRTTSRFIEDVRLKTTPVKNQGNSDLCWMYAMLATIETEHLMQGDSVNLSPIFLARHYLTEQAESFYLKQGREHISLRGMATMTLELIRKYGAHPYDYYHAHNGANFRVIEHRIEQMGRLAIARRAGLDAFRKQVDDLLDKELGYMPRYVHMLGAEYTSREFGQSVCLDNEYIGLTSSPQHSYAEEVELKLPDNRFHDRFLNLPPDTLMNVIDNALESGHPVCWEGSLKTIDDHCMALVGIAHDTAGRKYYIAKNSWGTEKDFDGFVYLSESDVRQKTVAVVVKASCFSN